MRALLLGLAATACVSLAQAQEPAQPGQVSPAPAELALPAAGAEFAAPAPRPEDALQPAVETEPAETSVLRDFGEGLASWYGPGLHGRRTANGERFDQHALTAAHRTLPFGTVVRVRSLVNGRTVDVRINDRGPVPKRRVIDLSRGAAAVLGLIESGAGVKRVALSLVRPRE